MDINNILYKFNQYMTQFHSTYCAYYVHSVQNVKCVIGVTVGS